MIKNVFFKTTLISLSVFCLLSSIAKSDDKNIFRVAVVDSQQIDRDSLISKDLQTKSIAKEKNLHEILSKRQTKITNDAKSLESKRAMLTGEELQKKAIALENEYKKLQIDEQMYAKKFELARMYCIKDIRDTLMKATNKVSAGKYDLVIPQETVFYVDASNVKNITKEVVSAMNSISKTVNFDKAYQQADSEINKMFEAQNKQAKKK